MAISGGKYLVGENGDYATLSAAINDIGTNVYTNLEFVIISPFTDVGMAALKSIQFGNPNLRMKITSAIDMKGKPACCFQISLTGTRSGGFFPLQFAGDKGGVIELDGLFVKNIDQPTSDSFQFVFTSASPHTNREIEVHGCAFDGNGFDNALGITAGGNILHKIWNNTFIGMPDAASATAAIYFQGSTAGFPYSFLDNCSFHEVDNAIRYQYGAYTNNCTVSGCVGNPWADAYGLTVGDLQERSRGNVDDYGMIIWDDPANKYDPELSDQFVSLDPTNKDFMVPVAGSYLENYGVRPEIAENLTDVEGTSKPTSSLAFCSGVVGRREKLREHWTSTRKFTIDGDKIKVSTSSIQFCLTQVADGMTDVMKAAKADGGDLRITTDRWGWEELPIEVAQWDPAKEKCMVWFKPAAVVAGEDYSFYLWFGNPNAGQVPLNHDYGQWNVWEDCNLILHCLEDPQEDGYVKDSSSGMHYGVFKNALATTWQDGMPDSGAIGKSYQMKRDGTGDNTYVEMPEGDYVNGDNYVQETAWVQTNVAVQSCPILDLGQASSGRRLVFQILATSQQAIVYAPDAASQSSASDSGALTQGVPGFLGMRIDLASVTKTLRWFADGQFTEQDTLSAATGAFTDSDSYYGVLGSNEAHSTQFRGLLQEIWLHNTDRSDGFNETFYENLENGSDFFKTPSAVNQRGCRDITFTTEDGEVHLSATDFYITYDPALYGGVVMTLNAVWEAVGLDQEWGLPRREAIESELRHLAKMIGKYGTLKIGPTYEHEYDKMTLSGVQVEVADNNTAIVYSISFNPEESYLLSRSIVFDGKRIDAQEFFVAQTRDDRTVFKDVFRAAPLRIEAGPNLTRVRITGLIAITGDAESSLAVRQRTETFLKEWSTIWQGTEGTLEIDGEEVGTAHLVNVEPSDLSIPGRIALSLDFATDYGS